GTAGIGTAARNLSEVILRAASVGEQRAKADVDRDRYRNDGQRDQKELNGQSGCGSQGVSRRGLALDQLVHGMGILRGISRYLSSAGPARPKHKWFGIGASFTTCVL